MWDEIIRQAMADLDSADEQVRAAAIETLGEYRHTPAVERLIGIAQAADPGTMFIAVKALGRIGDDRAVPLLLEQMRGNDMWVRAAATGALINIGAAAVNGLTAALRDEDKAVRRAAAKALGKIGEMGEDNQVTHGLSFALLDIDGAVRRFAAEALGRLGAETMVAELTEVLHDHRADVRIAAFKALAALKTPEAQQAVHNWIHE